MRNISEMPIYAHDYLVKLFCSSFFNVWRGKWCVDVYICLCVPVCMCIPTSCWVINEKNFACWTPPTCPSWPWCTDMRRVFETQSSVLLSAGFALPCCTLESAARPVAPSTSSMGKNWPCSQKKTRLENLLQHWAQMDRWGRQRCMEES